jgi:predicted dehydrogenase
MKINKNKKNTFSPIRVGIAGFGVVGIKRKKILDNLPGVKVVAISEKNKKRWIKNTDTKFLDNYKKIFKEELDVLFISLPNKYAADATIRAIKKNIDVFCEKPPARNLTEFKKVFNLYKKKRNIKIKYGFNHRYHDSIILAKKIIDSKRYGKVINLKGIYGKSKIITFTGQWRSKKSIAGGGILLDQGIHLLDLMRFFCGDFKEIKSLVTNHFWKHNIEDNAYAIMRSTKNIVAMIHSTATQWQHQFRIEITLEKALINLSGILSGSKTYGEEKIEVQPKNFKKDKKKIFKFNKDLSWERETTEYINCIKLKKSISSGTIFDAVKVMEIVDAIYKSDTTWKKKFF